jgi:hypothetical protein
MRELALRVRDLIVAGDRYRQTLAATLGVGVPEAVALGHLFHTGQLTPTAIAERLGVTTASVTGLLDRLAASGYLTTATVRCRRRSTSSPRISARPWPGPDPSSRPAWNGCSSAPPRCCNSEPPIRTGWPSYSPPPRSTQRIHRIHRIGEKARLLD